jgi:hypothetical protein
MHIHAVDRLRAGLLAAGACALCGLIGACQVSPPAESFQAHEGLVRADDAVRAGEVGAMLDRLAPRVRALLFDSRSGAREVWLQAEPALYAFHTSTYNDADGFWAEGARRIHLRERSENVERTLAHELVHASLGPSWRLLPGTLEEGLCDCISARLCPDSAARLAAGRLSSAAFATGGLLLELVFELPRDERVAGIDASCAARLRLEGDPPVVVDPLRVFDVRAGLSSTALGGDEKKAYYGLAFLVVERILDRVGVEGLHDLCVDAGREGLPEVPVQRLLAIADLDLDPASWRAAIAEGLGACELRELVRMHPEFLVATLAHFLEPYSAAGRAGDGRPPALLDRIAAQLSVCGNERSRLEIPSLAPLRARVERALAASEAGPACPEERHEK